MNTAATTTRTGPAGTRSASRAGSTPDGQPASTGMTLTTGDGITLLAGPVVDQAALHGLLHQLRDIGLPLVSVTQVEPDATARTPPPTPRPQEPDMTITAPTVDPTTAARRRSHARTTPAPPASSTC